MIIKVKKKKRFYFGMNLENIEKIYGIHACISVLNNKQRKVLKIFCTDDVLKKINNRINKKEYFDKIHIFERKELDIKLKTRIHQGIVVFCCKRKTDYFYKLYGEKIILILDSLNDPQNVGSIIRSAYLFGIKNIFFNNKNSFTINSVLIKAAAGAYEKVSLIPIKNIVNLIKDFKKNKFWIYGLDSLGTKEISEVDKEIKKVIILGSENKGIRKLVKENCDYLINIPMLEKDENIDSLNVSNAASILLYELSKK